MGAKVSILNTNPANAASAVKSLKDTNPSYEINTAQCDVSNYASVLSAFESCFSRYGTINIVIANAGINEEHQPSHQFLTSQPSLSPTSPPPLRALDVNLIGCLYTVYAGLFYIRKGGIGGTILCTSSNAGIYPFPFAPVYAASKHAIVGFVRSIAPPLKKENITINAITPSLVRESIHPSIFPSRNLTTINRPPQGQP